VPCVGLIVNDGKDLALATAERIESRFRQSGYDVVRASSAIGLTPSARAGNVRW
jgi:NAD+ kinase